MADDKETGKTANEVKEAKQEVKAEIDQANKTGGPIEIENARIELARKYLNELAASNGAAKEVRDINYRTGGASIDPKRKEAVDVKKTLVKVLEAVKAGIITLPGQSKVLFDELAERGGFTDTSASYLQPILEEFIKKDITFSKAGEELTDFEKRFRQLKKDNPIAAQQLGQILNDKINSFTGTSREDLQKQLEMNINDEGKVVIPEEEERRKAEEKTQQLQEERERIEEEKQNLEKEALSRHRGEQSPEEIANSLLQEFNLYLTEPDKAFLLAIYVPEKFIEYVEEEKTKAIEKIGKKDQELSHHDEEHVYELASEAIEHKLIEIVDKILTRFSETNPENFFEQVASQNFMRGITTTLATLGSYLDRLKTGLEKYENQEGAPKMFRSVGLEPIREDIQLDYEDETGKTVHVDKPRTRYRPLSKPEEVKLSGFASYMRLMLDEYVAEREYLHNSRAILMHPKEGDHGFYENLAHYAEKMKTPALEEMFLLPNADILQDAINLYDKFVDEQFASQDWKHTADMFLNKTGTVTTKLEEEVLTALKKMHPEMKESALKSALFMAVGAHRGVFMTEEEKAAYADPFLTPEGHATYTSYFTNDTDPLVPLNPAHFFMRWQAERSLPLWLFLPVEGKHPNKGLKTTGSWDHLQLWDSMKKYKDSYLKGRNEMQKDPLLIDFMLDISNVGGPSKRRGWRIYYSTQGHFVYKPDKETGKSTQKVDVLNTWKAIENIGYELCYDFVFIQRAGAGFLSSKYESSAEKKDFFEYLYKNYFLSDSTKFHGSQVPDFLKGLSSKAKELAELKLQKGLINRDKLEDQIEIERSNLFMSEALARLVAKRFPSKVLRIDRDRFHEQERNPDGSVKKAGQSRWNKIREDMKMSSSEFDKVMKNLCLAEAMLRKDVSKQMKTNLKEYASKNHKKLEDLDVGFHVDEVREGIDFRLTDRKIEDYLKDKVDKPEDLTHVMTLYKLLQENYIGENNNSQEFLQTFSRYLNPTITEEGSYTFTFGLDDTDMSLVAFRGTGGRLLARALRDTAATEKGVTAEIIGLNDKLHAAAINGKQDFSELVASLKKMRDTLADVHGPDYGQKVAHHMALAIINFFKQDTLGRSVFTSWMVKGKPQSLASEIYGGPLANVWEWDVATIDKFIYNLRIARVIPQQGFEPSSDAFELKDRYIDLFGKKIKVGKIKVATKKEYVWDEAALRRDAGAQGKHVAWEMITNIFPILLAFIVWKWLQEAAKELEGKKQ